MAEKASEVGPQRFALWIGLVVVSAILASVGQLRAGNSPEKVPGELFEQEATTKAGSVGRLRRANPSLPISTIIHLPELTRAERSQMSAPKLGTPLQLGVHRNVPVEWGGRINPSELEWESLPDDSQVATFSVRSPGARAIRLAIQFHSLPTDAEIRYYSPDSPDTFFGSYDRKLAMSDPGRGMGSQSFWSPLIAGEVIAVEIFVPDEESTREVWISLEEVAHVVRSPFDASFYKDIGDSGGCNKDLACSKKWERVGDSVALIIFERSSGVFACTGQLLSDTDPETLEWNFLTARHCINKKKVARSAIFLWFFQKAKCRGAPPSSIIQTAGGAKLKFKSPKVGTRNSTDHSLLRLRRDPPSGIALSGWSPDHFSTVVGKKVKGIHHPAGDLKKISKGTVPTTGYIQGALFFISQTRVSHYAIQWKKGVVEGGSSGSGLWIGSDWPDQYLVGVLTGGASTCSDRFELDFYGMFSETYRRYSKFRQILDPQ